MNESNRHNTPLPPNHCIKQAGHHWMEEVDSDGHRHGAQVCQWNPGAGRWSHSGYVGTGIYLTTDNWVYLAEAAMPGAENHTISVTYESFDNLQVEQAISKFLDYGNDSGSDYFGGSGWAARCLFAHLATLQAFRKAGEHK